MTEATAKVSRAIASPAASRETELVLAGAGDPGRARFGGREPRRYAAPRGALPGARDARIETRYYTGARHELLNETNRDEVQRDVLAWLAKTM